MLFILVSGVIGAGAAFVMLWPYGGFIACCGAPFGGGIFAGLAALWLGRRPAADFRRKVPSASGNEMCENRASRIKVNSPPE
jgi:hypothetical protein